VELPAGAKIRSKEGKLIVNGQIISFR